MFLSKHFDFLILKISYMNTCECHPYTKDLYVMLRALHTTKLTHTQKHSQYSQRTQYTRWARYLLCASFLSHEGKHVGQLSSFQLQILRKILNKITKSIKNMPKHLHLIFFFVFRGKISRWMKKFFKTHFLLYHSIEYLFLWISTTQTIKAQKNASIRNLLNSFSPFLTRRTNSYIARTLVRYIT